MSVVHRLSTASSFGVASAVAGLVVGGAVFFNAVASLEPPARDSFSSSAWTLRGALDPARAAKVSAARSLGAEPEVGGRTPPSTLHTGRKPV